MDDNNTAIQVYKRNVKVVPGTTIMIPQLSMLSHDNFGGMRIALDLLDKGATLVLEEYDMTLEPDDRWRAIKLSGPCMAMMVMRDAEERKRSTESPQ